MPLRLADCIPQLERAFAEEETITRDETPDLTALIFGLCPLVSRYRPGVLKEILVGIGDLSIKDPQNFCVSLSLLEDQLQLGADFARYPHRASGSDKVVGRCLCGLLAVLTPAQREAVTSWQRLAIIEARDGEARNSFREEEIDMMNDVLQWLLGGDSTTAP